MALQSSLPEAANPFPRFAIITPRLILLPTPLAIKDASYLKLYAHLHSLSAFCEMAFGDDFALQNWTIAERTAVIQREISASWSVRGMGDFALGLVPTSLRSEHLDNNKSSCLPIFEIVEVLQDLLLQDIQWIGYVGIRDATTTSIPKYNPTFHAEMSSLGHYPAWQDMVELRYGIDPNYWGKGFGTEAALAVMEWGKEKKGVHKYIAETEILNEGSKSILRKLGFGESRTNFWGMDGTVEWCRLASAPLASVYINRVKRL